MKKEEKNIVRCIQEKEGERARALVLWCLQSKVT